LLATLTASLTWPFTLGCAIGKTKALTGPISLDSKNGLI
jgi:hypothetical protein